MLREKRRELHEIKFITFRAFSLRLSITFSSVQFSRSVMSDSATPWTAACQASLSITKSCSLLKTHVRLKAREAQLRNLS